MLFFGDSVQFRLLPGSFFRARQEKHSAPYHDTAGAEYSGENPIFPMESPTKWVFIGSDEQRNERAFGKPAGSETIWSL